MLATCLGCGCACDDIQLRIEANRIREARNACDLGLRWFGDGSAPSRALAGSRDVSVEEALDAAARTLRHASRALVLLAPDISCETQRAAIALADTLHAAIDGVTSSTTLHSVLAAQEIGRASATLGEIRNRADVVVFWGVDPSSRYPRFATRYAPDPVGIHIGGRRDRVVIAVDVGPARGPEDADHRFEVPPNREVELLGELSASAARADTANAPAVLQHMLRGKYVALVADAEPDDRDARDDGRAAALVTLSQALNGPTRCAYIALRAGGNRSGADACLTAQTGYPMAVDFSRGYPRYRPYDHAAARLERGSVDALLIVGFSGLVGPRLAALLGRAPAIVIGPRATGAAFDATVAVDTAVAGIHEAGTALRMDDVPLPLGAPLSGPPATVDVVAALVRRLAETSVAPTAGDRQ